jgi:hypothetical protein
MGKLARLLKPKAIEPQGVVWPRKCERCEWDFTKRHTEEIKRKDRDTVKRSIWRTEIRIPLGGGKYVTRCGECYSAELMRQGAHQMAGHEDVHTMHHQSIEAEFSRQPKLIIADLPPSRSNA